MGLRIGIDCDGVLRDLIPCITESIKETHPQHADKILEPNSWNWSDWLPFWTEEKAEEYIFEENYLDGSKKGWFEHYRNCKENFM